MSTMFTGKTSALSTCAMMRQVMSSCYEVKQQQMFEALNSLKEWRQDFLQDFLIVNYLFQGGALLSILKIDNTAYIE